MARSHPWQLANVRVGMLARSLRRRLGDGVDVTRVRYRFRGWNPARLDALRDARSALDRVRETVDPADIVASTQDAYRRRELHEARYAVFHTGPSATADIEGVLIHGAQGVRSLTVVLLPPRT